MFFCSQEIPKYHGSPWDIQYLRGEIVDERSKKQVCLTIFNYFDGYRKIYLYDFIIYIYMIICDQQCALLGLFDNSLFQPKQIMMQWMK